MVDKDYNELNLIHQIFPKAQSHICLFHIMKAMKKKLAKFSHGLGGEHPEILKHLLQKMAHAQTDGVYQELYTEMTPGFSLFLPCLDANWHRIQDKWAFFHRMQHFWDTTNNRVESMNRKIKSTAWKNSLLDVMFRACFYFWLHVTGKTISASLTCLQRQLCRLLVQLSITGLTN